MAVSARKSDGGGKEGEVCQKTEKLTHHAAFSRSVMVVRMVRGYSRSGASKGAHGSELKVGLGGEGEIC